MGHNNIFSPPKDVMVEQLDFQPSCIKHIDRFLDWKCGYKLVLLIPTLGSWFWPVHFTNMDAYIH